VQVYLGRAGQAEVAVKFSIDSSEESLLMFTSEVAVLEACINAPNIQQVGARPTHTISYCMAACSLSSVTWSSAGAPPRGTFTVTLAFCRQKAGNGLPRLLYLSSFPPFSGG
jgi:hypothetical protein